MRRVTTPKEWHVRRQRRDARTLVLWFIDANADRMSLRAVIEDLATEPEFRSYFLQTVAESDMTSFVLETPLSAASGEFECALTNVPAPKKVKIDPQLYASSFAGDGLVAVVPSADGDGALVVPRPLQVEGWYADLPTFFKRIREEQQLALLEAVARTAREALATQQVCISSSAPGAPWLQVRVGSSAKRLAYSRYRR